MEKKKGSSKWVIIIIVALICAFCGYQGFHLYFYNINGYVSNEYDERSQKIKISQTIDTKVTPLKEGYLTFKNIQFRNDFSVFEVKDMGYESSDQIIYTLNDEKGKVKNSLSISIGNTYIDKILDSASSLNSGNSFYDTLNKKKILEKNKIDNDIELIRYLIKNKGNKNTFFTSVSKMKENFFIQYTLAAVLPEANCTLIKGDHTGYIMKSSEVLKQITILKDEKSYNFLFTGPGYDDAYLESFVKTIVVQ